MSKRPWVPIYVGDLLADTMNFTPTQFGGYMRILFHYWITEEPMTLHEMQAASGLSRTLFKKSWCFYSKKFVCENDKYFNRRMRREIIKAVDLSEKRAKAGSKGGQAIAQANDTQLPKQLHTQLQSQLHIKESGVPKPSKKTPPPIRIEKEIRDYSEWSPSESTVGRIQQNCPGDANTKAVTTEFINSCIPEFQAYAEEHYRPDQMQSRFIKSVTADFKRQGLNGHRKTHEAKFKVPTDSNKVMKWAKDNDYPIPKIGESMAAYTTRMERFTVERKREGSG